MPNGQSLWLKDFGHSYYFPGGSDGKTSAYNAGDPGLIPGLGRSPGQGNRQLTPVFLCVEFHGILMDGQGGLAFMGLQRVGHD